MCVCVRHHVAMRAPVSVPAMVYHVSAFNHARPDGYHWLRDDSRTNAAVLRHLQLENDFTDSVLAPMRPLRDSLLHDIGKLTPSLEMRAPWRHGEYWYREQRAISQEYFVLVRQPVACVSVAQETNCNSTTETFKDTAQQEVVFDPNSQAHLNSYYDIGKLKVSPTGHLLAYTLDTVGDEGYKLCIQYACHLASDDASLSELDTALLADCGSEVEWSCDSQAVFVIQSVDAIDQVVRCRLTLPPSLPLPLHALHPVQPLVTAAPLPTVMHQPCNSAPSFQATLEVMFEAGEDRRQLSLSRSRDGHYLLLSCRMLGTRDILVAPAASVGPLVWHSLLTGSTITDLSSGSNVGSMPCTMGTSAKTHQNLHSSSSPVGTPPTSSTDGATATGEPHFEARSTSSSTSIASTESSSLGGMDILRADHWRDGTFIMLVDSDDAPDGKLVAVTLPALACPAADRSAQTSHEGSCHSQAGCVLLTQAARLQSDLQHQQHTVDVHLRQLQPRPPPPQPPGGEQLPPQRPTALHQQVIVPGAGSNEVTDFVVGRSHLAVLRSHNMRPVVDIYSLSSSVCAAWGPAPLGSPAETAAALRNAGVSGSALDHGAGKAGQQAAPPSSSVSSHPAGMPQLRLKAAHSWTLDIGPGAWVVDLDHGGGAGSFDSPLLRVVYSSMATPATTLDVDMATRKMTIAHVETVLGGFEPCHYVTELLWTTSHDGVHVPLSVAYRRDMMRRDGSNPCILQGYGAYGSRQQPRFNVADIVLLDRGVVMALAHVRGGGELGSAWHTAAQCSGKHNTFEDFVAAGRLLVAGRYTSTAKLAAWGRSAGGLTVGAALNLAPDLFAAAVLDVPFLDVLTTMSDPTLPLTRKERREWGDPLASRCTSPQQHARHLQEEYGCILAYSPYDNLEASQAPQAGCSGNSSANVLGSVGGPEQHALEANDTTAPPLPACAAARQQAAGPSGVPGAGQPADTRAAVAAAAAAAGCAVPLRQRPHLLLTASLHDWRVNYWEPAKYVARMRALDCSASVAHEPAGRLQTVGGPGSDASHSNSTEKRINDPSVCLTGVDMDSLGVTTVEPSCTHAAHALQVEHACDVVHQVRAPSSSPSLPPRMLLLRTNMQAGHFSSTGTSTRLVERAEKYAFLLTALGAAGGNADLDQGCCADTGTARGPGVTGQGGGPL